MSNSDLLQYFMLKVLRLQILGNKLGGKKCLCTETVINFNFSVFPPLSHFRFATLGYLS